MEGDESMVNVILRETFIDFDFPSKSPVEGGSW